MSLVGTVFLMVLAVNSNGDYVKAKYNEPFKSIQACEEAAPALVSRLNAVLAPADAKVQDFKCVDLGTVS